MMLQQMLSSATKATPPLRSAGFLLIALMITVIVLSISSSVAVKDWTIVMQREKEKELIFRGEEITRAIELFQNPPARGGKGTLPNTLEQLVKEGYLRKLYPDPTTVQYDEDGEIVEETGEWELIHAGRSGKQLLADHKTLPRRRRRRSRFDLQRTGPIIGVRSTSEVESIGTREGVRGPYNQWEFIATTRFSRPRHSMPKLPHIKKQTLGGGKYKP